MARSYWDEDAVSSGLYPYGLGFGCCQAGVYLGGLQSWSWGSFKKEALTGGGFGLYAFLLSPAV